MPIYPDDTLYPANDLFPSEDFYDNPIALRVYQEVKPVTYDDEAQGFALYHFIHAWTKAMMAIEEIIRPSSGTEPWSSVLVPEAAPAAFLNWLGQMVGLDVSLKNEFQKRDLIRNNGRFFRGSPASIVSAAKQSLTGSKTVILNERHGSAWRMTVTTLDSETPNPGQKLQDILTQKPGGIVLTSSQVDGTDYETFRDTHSDYQDIIDTYATYAEVVADPDKQ